MDKEALKKAIAEKAKGLKIPGEFPSPQVGGILFTKCKHCGGHVMPQGEGIIIERCSSCGKEHHETVFRVLAG